MDALTKITDTSGHNAGDSAIKAEAHLLKSVFRTSDVIGSLGGDEFGIIAVGLTAPVFEKIKLRLKKICAEWNEQSKEPFQLSISLGYANFTESDNNLKKLLSSADKLLYEEKRLKKQTS